MPIFERSFRRLRELFEGMRKKCARFVRPTEACHWQLEGKEKEDKYKFLSFSSGRWMGDEKNSNSVWKMYLSAMYERLVVIIIQGNRSRIVF
mmetsp:Transcript_10503/g.14834  ORF Transcript_10503/g.14834 Transcript_10503/m.14834 type:complete len:92 (-) Transcript_10503:86-361(-)